MGETTRYQIYSIEGNRQRLDGGAMFGNVPRALWQRWIPADERHRIELACRGFLIHDVQRQRRILLEAGIGVFFEPKLRDRFGVEQPEHVLQQSLARRGVAPDQVDVVVLSHLHFDHIGGLVTPWRKDAAPQLLFPDARYVVGQRAWERAWAPHLRDRASFIPEILELLRGVKQQGRLELVDDPGRPSDVLGADFGFHLSDGHTPGMLLTQLTTPRGSAVFCGDLIPGLPWIHLPVTMGYDRYPERLIDEKRRLLEGCLERGTLLLLTHDPDSVACGVQRDQRGRFTPHEPRQQLDGLAL